MDERGAAVDKQTKRRPRLVRVLALVARCLLAGLALAAPAWAASAPAASSEAGLPFIRNFDPRSYGAAAQNWSLAQDRQGVIYVGNVDGAVLAFDGARWQRIPVPNRAAVRSLALGADGRIYVGTVGDLGYLEPDATGQLGFVSLRDKIPPSERDFADVWSIHPTADGVFFATSTQLFRYRNGAMEVWKPKTSFHLSFLVDGKLYIREVGLGLLQLDGERLELSPGGSRFADEKIYALLPWRGPDAQPGDLLAGTRTQGWFIRQGDSWRPWTTEADAAIRKGQLYNASWLADGRLAAGTLRGGLFLLDAQGHLLRTLTRGSGLSTNMMLAQFQDREGGLWIAAGNGISRIDLGSPLTYYGERGGLPDGVLALRRHAGTLYAGTTDGLYRLVDGADAHFERLPRVTGQIWGLAEVDDELLVASSDGVFALADGTSRQLLDTRQSARSTTALSLRRSTRDPARVFVGYPDGIGTLRHEGDRWIDGGRIAGVRQEVRTIRQDADGHVWLSLWVGGAIRLSLPPDWQGPRDGRTVRVERFGTAEGLPPEQNDLAMIDGRLRFTTPHGIYRFDEASGRFSLDPAFAGLFPGGPQPVDVLRQDRRGGLWMYAVADADGGKQTGHAVHAGQGWRWADTPLQPLAGIDMSVFLDDADGTVWLGGDKGLYRYQPTRAASADPPPRTLLRMAAEQGGRVLFADHLAAARPPEIPYAQNSIRFEFALPSYEHSDANRYQVWLQGLDRDWSSWSDDAYRDYTNLPEGRYRFHVRARNVYGRHSQEATFDFRILPPWYRTAWAWLLWVAAGMLALSLLVRWRSAALRRRNRALAGLVARRTGELAQANRALREANEALAQQIVTDPLTGLKNRRYLSEHIEHDLAAARRHCRDHGPGAQLLFLMVDIDHFKQINDSYGHATGDRVLLQFRDVLLSVTRESDTPVRRGGEEFLIVARFAPPEAGPQFAERIRAAVAEQRFELGNGRHVHLSCSIGFASYPFYASEPERLNWEQVVNIADECLYAAKRQGRNAWAGVAPVATPPAGSAIDALHATFARLPEPGPLPVQASWACAEPLEA
ncbi:ligand-binding sensor domain-containing diguanylate cyclase [Rhodanobacter sp. C06]|uniref:ligand-binding sensor domain-containing diguanylate cyclase n=1 Tax=Rhodanobacter sp. C06 TaxID=1945854 RepID=UPI000985B95B|nr:ligand-binding sensor domain-containing diguanylate cyclase [Rhodanobacter sp. C06]